MSKIFASFCALALLSLGLGQCSSEKTSDPKGFGTFQPIAKNQQPKNLKLIRTLDWPTEEQARDLSYINNKVTDRRLQLDHLRLFYGRSLDEKKFCMQLVQAYGSQLVMVHSEGCPTDKTKLLGGDKLMFWLVVGKNGIDLYNSGRIVGTLLKKKVKNVEILYTNDLCTFRSYDDNVPAEHKTASTCDVYAANGTILGLVVRSNYGKPKLDLKGFAYSKAIPFRGKVEPTTCPAPDRMIACTSQGSATSSACYKAGFKMIWCGDCSHVCAADFTGVSPRL